MKDSLRMFREEIAESHSFIIGTYLYIEPITGVVFLGETKGAGPVMIAYTATLTVKRLPGEVCFGLVSHGVHFQIVHPAGRLFQISNSQSHFPYPVVQFQPGTRLIDYGL